MNNKKENKEVPLEMVMPFSLERLSDEELQYLIQCYVTNRQDFEHIATLIKDDLDTITQMIDSKHVFEKVMHGKNPLIQTSPYFLFILLLRKIFRQKQKDSVFINDVVEELNRKEQTFPWNKNRVLTLLNSADISDYLANMLALFVHPTQLGKPENVRFEQCKDITDMVEEIPHSDNKRKFYMYCYIGNYTLFFTGMFPEYIERRVRYKDARVEQQHYYIHFGKTYFELASEHDIAKHHKLNNTLYSLSEGFEIFIKLLQYMRNEYLTYVHK